jgi:hypothetical protein
MYEHQFVSGGGLIATWMHAILPAGNNDVFNPKNGNLLDKFYFIFYSMNSTNIVLFFVLFFFQKLQIEKKNPRL